MSASKTIPQKAVVQSAAYDNTYVPNSITIDHTKSIGEIPFTSNLSSSGAMTYNVPVEIYPGIRGFQPQIALVYNHLAGNGIAGMGWNIAGLSSIARTTKNIYYDGAVQGINLNKTDAFVLDGMRLIKLSETTTQIKYESEQGNIKVNATISGNVVKYFTVLYPNGNVGTYGYTTNTADKLQYPLTSLTDAFGNVITYVYTYTNNHYKISSITYGGASNASIEFQYKSREDPITIYEAGLKVLENNLLEKIVCKFGTTTLRTYELSYQLQKNSNVLSQIGCTASGSSLNPLQFYYGENNTAYTYSKAETQLSSWYTFSQPGELKVAKGKFDYTDNDGVVVLPNKNPYWEAYIIIGSISGCLSSAFWENSYNLQMLFVRFGVRNKIV